MAQKTRRHLPVVPQRTFRVPATNLALLAEAVMRDPSAQMFLTGFLAAKETAADQQYRLVITEAMIIPAVAGDGVPAGVQAAVQRVAAEQNGHGGVDGGE